MWNRSSPRGADEKVLTQQNMLLTGRRLEIGGDVTDIGHHALSDNKHLRFVRVPPSVRRIGDWAFSDCEALEEVILSEGLEHIGRGAFSGCKNLKSITIPSSVKEATGRSFSDSGIERPVLSADGRTLYYCPAVAAGEAYTVPEGVRKIASWAFLELPNLREVTLPEGLEQIDKLAFLECGLRGVTIPAGTWVEPFAFKNCKDLARIAPAGISDPVAAETLVQRAQGHSFLRAQWVPLPSDAYWRKPEFRALTDACVRDNPSGAEAMIRFFEARAAARPDAPFFALAANFWRYRAYERGSRDAAEWLAAWLRGHPGERLPSPYLAETLSGALSGRALNALGFPFFDPEREYALGGLARDGVVEISSYASEDGPDEDGYGSEIYYDWWYMGSDLRPIPGAKPLLGYSNIDRRISGVQQRFRALRELVASQCQPQTHP